MNVLLYLNIVVTLHKIMDIKNKIFAVKDTKEFETVALEVFHFQFKNIPIYRKFCQLIGRSPDNVKSIESIPFIPVEFFKNHTILPENVPVAMTFLSSGTSGMNQSRHYLADLSLYENSFMKGFEHFYGKADDYIFFALLPAYLEREGSSLIYMVETLINQSKHPKSGFYLNNYEELLKNIKMVSNDSRKKILIGVSFALLDLAENYKPDLTDIIVMETGGMKGRRKEMVKDDLHKTLEKAFNISQIHSEYGMTELLSQAYSYGRNIFACPPWMKVLCRDTNDPLSIIGNNKTGGINVIDLANLYSCSFIATQDLGKTHDDGCFEVLGRFDNSDIRGCNLLVVD